MPENKHYPQFWTWICCTCRETIQSVAVNPQCSNGQCQHLRCEDCGINDSFPNESGLSFPQGHTLPFDQVPVRMAEASGSGGPSGGEISGLPSPRRHNSEGSLELSEEMKERLAEIHELKAAYKSTFDEAVKMHDETNSTSAADQEKSALERYLYDLIRPWEFVFAWEWSILPFLVEILPEWLGRGYALNVTRDPRNNIAQTICFTSKIKPTRTRRMIIARHVLDIIPDKFCKNTAFQFCHGTVDFLQRGTDKKNPDDVCDARNPYSYRLPMMGDSIGPGAEEAAATLGPSVKFGDRSYWLANLHVFLKQLKRREINIRNRLVLHPGLLDNCGHSIVKHVIFGTVHACSGDNLKTTRPSSHPYWKIFPKSTCREVVTDWVLIDDGGHTQDDSSKKHEPFLNTLRIPGAESVDFGCITKLGQVFPEAKVHSTGRTSGHQYGQICTIPAYVDADVDGRGAKNPTREWYIEQPSWIKASEEDTPEEDWLEGGIGIPGDSGAPVIDYDNSSLYGQIWGRNKYWGPGPRITYFTAISDIAEDIQEKCPELGSVLELPQRCSRERRIESELYCPRCIAESSTPHLSDANSDDMSVMSVSTNGPSHIVHNAEETLADEEVIDLEHSSTTQSDSDEIMSVDSGNAIVSYSPIDREEFVDLFDLLPPASNNDAALAMALDPFQFYNGVEHNFGVNDETLSIDEDNDEEDEMDFIGRSCARKKKPQSSASRETLFDSWVMVRAKSKKARTKKITQPRKTPHSLIDSLFETTELMTDLSLT